MKKTNIDQLTAEIIAKLPALTLDTGNAVDTIRAMLAPVFRERDEALKASQVGRTDLSLPWRFKNQHIDPELLKNKADK
jgi:hypothetical protein